MEACFLNNSMYLKLDTGKVLKFTQYNMVVDTTIEFVDSFPKDGLPIEPNDILVQSILDNAKQFITDILNTVNNG